MAEAAVLAGLGWVVSPIVTRLLNEGFSYIGDADIKDRLEKLESTIPPHLQLAVEAAENSEHKKTMELWLRKFKSAFYEVEDMLDLCKYQFIKEVSDLNTYPSFIKPFMKVERKVINTMISIFLPEKINLRRSLKKLEMVAAEFMTFREFFEMQIGVSTTARDLENGGRPNITTSVPPCIVFGRDNEYHTINEYLLDQSEASETGNSYSVVAIVGIGGAGKTTLAQLIYNDQRIVDYFDIKIWVNISQKLDVLKHTREMVKCASKKEFCLENIDSMQPMLLNLLKSKKVLLVLDNVWCDKIVNEAEWKILLAPLATVGKGSKILVTTRTQNLSTALHPQYSITLRALKENDIVFLFMQHAVGDAKFSDKHLQEELENIGKQIVHNLHGSPLVAKVVGDQLSKSLEANFWRATLDQNNFHDIQQALLWSYQRLDAPLRRCFSYFSLFPKDYWFKVEEMVHLWIAEGFIDTSKNSKTMKDIGMYYFNELVSGSFVDLVKDFDGTQYWRMHDLIHDLATLVSKEDCFRIENDQVQEIPSTIRRLYVSDVNTWVKRKDIHKQKNLRTLIISEVTTISVTNLLRAAIVKFKKLRVLILSGRGIHRLPHSIGGLKHLRYLDLQGCEVGELPRSMNNLINLRHFNGDNSALTSLADIGRLTSLQTLPKFDVKKEKGYDIGQLKNLKELQGSLIISNLGNVQGKDKAMEANLEDKEHLESLRLIWKNDNESDSRRDLDREVLEGLRPHCNLINLSIEGYQSPSCPNWLLRRGCLQNLRSVEFKNCTSLEVLPPMGELFPSCCKLEISSLPNLKKFHLLPQHLKELAISDCRSLVFFSNVRLKDNFGEQEKIDEEKRKDISGEQETTEVIFPSWLESLKIEYCDITDGELSQSLERLTTLKSLKLCGISTISALPSEEVLRHLIALNHLEISYCCSLRSLGGLYALPFLEDLAIDTCSRLELEMVMPSEGGGGGGRMLPLSLQFLNIAGCRSMKSFVVAGDLPNLAKLQVLNCLSLASLSLSHLTALTRLEIEHCPSISSLSDLPMSLHSLRLDLRLDGSSGISSFPVHLPESLSILELSKCHGISSFPIHLPESLSNLQLWNCPDILSLPDLPESLTFIGIFGCPVLKERCRDPNGEDWPKISRIPQKIIW
ncbi:disease resistance protein RGA2-like [Typha angustifolia]|uniref:disease resistance protein RGA2-like n=1 Tax=Typha angustifolia TaxID=59011 RepID=UPI003C2CF46B